MSLRRADVRVADRGARTVSRPLPCRPQHRIDLHRDLLASHVHLAQVAGGEEVFDLRVRGLAHDDGDAELLRQRLQARAEVDGVPDGGVLEALLRADGAYHRLSRVDSHAAPKPAAISGGETVGEGIEALLELERRPHGPRGMGSSRTAARAPP